MRERTPFWERLYKAMTHAKLSQPALAEAAGVSQGTIGELVWKGNGSMAVVRLAKACGVRPEWLSEGEGDMLDANAWPFSLVTLEDILALDETQRGIVEGAMLNALERIHGPAESALQTLRNNGVRRKNATNVRTTGRRKAG